MKRLQYTLLALALATMAACDNSDVFYATTYPIVRVGVTVEPEEITPPETTAPENPDEEEPTEPEPPTKIPNPIISEIETAVLADAPVTAGGRYMLDFTKYNGGPLHVRPSADGALLNGTFVKRPASDSLAFSYNELEYVCVRDTYQDELGTTKVVLTVDLTAHYQELHPDATITKVLRMEYTSANAK